MNKNCEHAAFLSNSCTFKILDNGLGIYGENGTGVAIPGYRYPIKIIENLLTHRPISDSIKKISNEVGADVTSLVEALFNNGILKSKVEGSSSELSFHSALCELLDQVDQFISQSQLSANGLEDPTPTIEILRCALSLAQGKLDSCKQQFSQIDHIELENYNGGKLRLILGAGKMRAHGWTAIDLTRDAQQRFDITKQWPLTESCVTSIYIGHVLEHFEESMAKATLEHSYRALISGGFIRVVVPDARAWLKAYVDNDNDFFEAVYNAWPHWRSCDSKLNLVMTYLGGGTALSRAFGHKSAYDFEQMSRMLKSVGFTDIQRSTFGASFPDGSKCIDNHSSLATITKMPDQFALYVFARK
ncbi:hypothetical protein UNDKW_0197 [Undibacterium sp. KW1]|uniref:class I SAM-dependent methyltransferase n=1 Tax=Undibacterium sp. KW1 TaxID=2058624 RepID=UPI001331D337|nr:hypothetical protein [Undibacterium sp. KW1]BBB58470.1 hypothetical protein UNDKW_0197 [Undibacterium sp. KW1]